MSNIANNNGQGAGEAGDRPRMKTRSSIRSTGRTSIRDVSRALWTTITEPGRRRRIRRTMPGADFGMSSEDKGRESSSALPTP